MPEFEPQPGDIRTIYDETPPFWNDKEIGQWQSSLMTMDGKKLDRFYVDYDSDTNEFPVVFEDTFLGQDGLNPDEELFRLDLKLHQREGKRMYTDALRGARWDVEVTVDDKRVLRVRVTPPKNLAQLIERKKQNQQLPKIDRSFPELGDAFKRIKTPEQLKQAREQLKKLIERIGEIDDSMSDLTKLKDGALNIENEPITALDPKVYPLDGVDPDLLRRAFVASPGGDTIEVKYDTDRSIFTELLIKVGGVNGLKKEKIYTIAGANGQWEFKLFVDTKIINGVTQKILRVAVKPPQAWIDKQQVQHVDEAETPGKPFVWPVDNLRAPIT